MALHKRITEELIAAMKAKDTCRLSVLRMLKTELQRVTIRKNISVPSDEECIRVIRKDVARHRDSISQFEKGGREDLARREREELDILTTFLPPAPTRNELAGIIKAVIRETGACGEKDFGPVMKETMKRTGGYADGKLVSDIVHELLATTSHTEET